MPFCPPASLFARVAGASGLLTKVAATKPQANNPQILRNFLSLSQSLDSGLVPERRSVSEPLARMASPASERRSRLLADALPAVATMAGSSNESGAKK